MTDKPTDSPIEVPKWDVALEALAGDECRKKGEGLTVADFKRLAGDHATRFDDIMVTIFELTLQGLWQYRDANGKPRDLTRNEVNDLYVGGRIHEKDMGPFDGSWSPLKS